MSSVRNIFILFTPSTMIIVLLFMVSYGFPIDTRHLQYLENDGNSNHDGMDIAKIQHCHFCQFRIRHERRRTNRLKEALIYLRRFGYLENGRLDQQYVTAALRSFQQVLGVRETGELDWRTLIGMRMPRCGNTDVETPVQEQRRKKRFAQVSRWINKMDEDDVLQLRWHIEKYTNDIPRENIRTVIKRAFEIWTNQVPIQAVRTLKLSFEEATDTAQSDINILWAEGEHSDLHPFDGPGNTTNILAHTFYPNYQEGSLNGDIHFDDYEKWVLDDSADRGGVRFPYVLVHEIGHALGLGHSLRQEALMNPIYKQTPLDEITLDIDDRCAVNWNYVGPTRTCLFIWLLIEYLPRTQETNSHVVHGFSSATGSIENNPGDRYEYNHTVGELILDDRVKRTWEKLQNVHVPQCTVENGLQYEYETLLSVHLGFSPEIAQSYGPMVCQFFDGLREVIARRKLEAISANSSDQRQTLKPDSLDTTASEAIRLSDQPLVHSYHRRGQFHSDSNETARMNPINQDYFNDQFYDRLLQLAISSHLKLSDGR